MTALQYENIKQQYLALIENVTWEAALVSLIALLKQELPKVSWVGFYRNIDEHLWIGPYQGKLACIHLKPGQGVCGQALKRRETLIVPDVHAFAGHVACDALSRSEIVVPVFRQNPDRTPVGVLDLDSYERGAFAATDQKLLEELLKAIETWPDRVS